LPPELAEEVMVEVQVDPPVSVVAVMMGVESTAPELVDAVPVEVVLAHSVCVKMA